jgi:type II secretory pathway component GspD/PulD (secretin)
VTTLDGKEATIKATESRPYSELMYESGSSNVVGKTYKFVDVGVTLGVTPRINELGFISCDIRPEVSSAPYSEYYDADPNRKGTGVPTVRKQYAETSVSVRDGVTIIIGGMITDEDSKTTKKVPFLGSIPLLGVLFRSEIETKNMNEIIVLLTPRVVTGDKFFERSKDMKKPMKDAINASGGITVNEMTP